MTECERLHGGFFGCVHAVLCRAVAVFTERAQDAYDEALVWWRSAKV